MTINYVEQSKHLPIYKSALEEGLELRLAKAEEMKDSPKFKYTIIVEVIKDNKVVHVETVFMSAIPEDVLAAVEKAMIKIRQNYLEGEKMDAEFLEKLKAQDEDWDEDE